MSPPRQRRRTCLLAAVIGAAAAVAGPAPAAQAHGGFQILAKTSGPYAIVVRARPFKDGGTSKIDVTSYVVRQDLGEPDLSAHVHLELRDADGTRSLDPPVVGDGYEAIIDAPPEAWRTWAITARVSGTGGTATVQSAAIGAEPGSPTWLIPLSAVLLALMGAGLVLRRRAAASAGSGDEDDDDGELWAGAPPTP